MRKNITFGIVLVVVLMIVGAASIMGARTAANADKENLNAAFRDGTYLGRLAAARGESPHISSGRWAQAIDRRSFAAGYERAYRQQMAILSQNMTELANAAFRDATNAAFRDGSYIGKLYAEEGRPVHISTGRWSRAEDRAAFTTGYTQAYDMTSLAQEESHINVAEASQLR